MVEEINHLKWPHLSHKYTFGRVGGLLYYMLYVFCLFLSIHCVFVIQGVLYFITHSVSYPLSHRCSLKARDIFTFDINEDIN